MHVHLLTGSSRHRVSERFEIVVGGRFEVDGDVHVVEALVSHDGRLVGGGALMGVRQEVDHRVVPLPAQVAELFGAHHARRRQPFVDPAEVVTVLDGHRAPRTAGQASVSSTRVVHHDLALIVKGEGRDVLEEVARMAHAFCVRPIGTEEDPLDREVLRQFGDAVLHEGCDPAVLVELVDRVGLEHAGVLSVEHLEPVEQVTDPGAPVLDVGHPQAEVPFEQLVGDEDAGEVVDEAMLHEHRDDGRVLIDGVAAEAGRTTPLLGERLADLDVAILEAGVGRDDDSRFGDACPKRVEPRIGR